MAKELGESSLMWLVHPTLTQAEVAKTAAVVAQVLQQASAHDGCYLSHGRAIWGN